MRHAELPDRFWEKVNKTAACWIWTAYTMPNGYGQFRFEGKSWLAHRLSFTAMNGEVPPHLDIDHTCRNRKCVNPNHLQAVSRSLNNQNQNNENRNSRSGLRGVYWCDATEKWRVIVTDGTGRRKHIGRFNSLREANDAVVSFRRENYLNSLADRVVNHA